MDKATPIRALSGPGKEIFEKMLKPLFLDVSQYDRVASYYNPRSLALILRELASLWKRGGTVRLILGFHERMEILPALRTDLEIRKSIKRAVAESMKGEVSALVRILGLDRESVIGVVRELLNQRALHVKLVTPRTNLDYYKSKGEWPRMEPATFHSKFMILHYGDANHSDERSFFSRLFRRWKDQHFYRPAGQRILAGRRFSVVTTSMNESVKAYTHNIEDAVLHRSWVQNEQQVSEYFLNRFEKLWMDNCDDAASMPFTDEFEEVLLEAVADEQPQYLSWSDFTAAIKESMIYHAISFPKVGLLPHQIGVYKQALSRWPVRVLLSDEVGLGKTIEGASIISFLMKNGYVNRCLVLTPASLRKQWQSELRSLFGLDFWVFNPSSGFLEGATNDHFVANDPLGNAGEIRKIIVSWHWARIGADSDALRIIKETMPDLLVVDEAHHARIRDTGSGEYHTQLYTLLKRAQEHIPHILLLTATPFQTDVLDYFSLLDILGVPEDFRDDLNEFGKWARGDIHDRRANKLRQLKAMHRYIRLYNLKTEFSFLRDLHETELQGTTYYASILDRIGSLPRESVIATHPTTLLSIRNLRSTLEEIGYTFPEAHMDAPDIKISDEQSRFLQQIDDYVSNFLGLPEQELNTGGHIGLMRSLYRQRMVSSIKAAFDTLSRRREKLDSFIRGAAFSELEIDKTDEFDSANNDENDSMPDLIYAADDHMMLKALSQKALTEIQNIDRLLFDLRNAFFEQSKVKDPKLARLNELLRDHSSKDRRILVFSRFTSTTSAIIDELEEFVDRVGVGRFDGECARIYRIASDKVEYDDCSRGDIVEALQKGRIGILVCSDAASEGLNLHAANVVINVDVPWNPSRLLQRFGRVDRLGQVAEDVYLINLYYPNSIEERMYSVLEARRTDFRAVLGEVPEIMSDQQKRVVTALSAGKRPKINLTLQMIENERKLYQQNSMLIDSSTADDTSLNVEKIYKNLIETLKEAADRLGRSIVEKGDLSIEINGESICLDPLGCEFIGFCHLDLSHLETSRKESGVLADLHQLIDSQGNPICLSIIDENHIIPVLAKHWMKMFEFLFIGRAIDISDMKRYSIESIAELLSDLRSNESWIWPDLNRMKCLSSLMPATPSIGELKIGSLIGKVLLRP